MFTITASSNMKRRLDGTNSAPRKKVQRIMSMLPDRMMPKTAAGHTEKSPDTVVQEKVMQHVGITVETPSYNELNDFFHAPTQAEIDAYKHDILAAVRSSKVDTLRNFYKEGRPMKCSNEFGESILHLACRKGLTDVAKFLVEEAKVPVQICDDYGRNPLHDACWVHKPNFELMDLILKRCPDLLFIKDRRGHTPLSFARRDQWKLWNDYLKQASPELLIPHQLITRQKQNGNNANTTKSTASGGPAATNVPVKVDANRPRLSASGIKIPTFTPQVAAKGIKIPIATSGINLAVMAASQGLGGGGGTTTATAAAVAATNKNTTTSPSPFPLVTPIVPEKNTANVLLKGALALEQLGNAAPSTSLNAATSAANAANAAAVANAVSGINSLLRASTNLPSPNKVVGAPQPPSSSPAATAG